MSRENGSTLPRAILRDIRTALTSGSTFDVWRLDDQTAGNIFNGKAVPYDFDIETWLVLRDTTNGLDYAAVHLREYYRSQLEAGGVTGIGRNAWGDHLTEHDYWIVMGIPSETVTYDGKTIINARVVMSPLTPTNVPIDAGNKSQNQFYAKPIEGSETCFKDADGLSGAPIFALKKQNGRWFYNVIGIQSTWYYISRTLAICPFSSLGFALEEIVAEARAVQSPADQIDTH
jgi:hypothetical protein